MIYIIFAAMVLFAALIARAALKNKEKKGLANLVTVVGALFCVGILLLSCFETVPTGHTGVVTTFGHVENFTLNAGVHMVKPWQQVVKMDNRVQKQTVKLACFSSDIQEVNMA